MIQTQRIIIILTTVGMILMIPFIAMQFTNEVDWKIGDFLAMGVLLTATGLLFEVVIRKTKTLKQRIILCGVVLLGFLIVWAELAVGLFGTPFAGS